MDKLEKVICALENCTDTPRCKDCPWETCEACDGVDIEIPRDLAVAALELLKAQEQKCRECGEATSKAIQELQAKLKAQEPSEDWISRKRLKDEIQYYIDEAGWGDEANEVLGWCMEFIDNQRAVKWE